MSTDGNKALARRIVEEMWNTRNLAVIDEIYAPAEDGHEEVRTRVSSYLSAFPDLHVTIDGQTAEGDWVATRFSSNGTHLGALFGVPATGERTAAAGVEVHRFADGRLVDLWNSLDLTGVLRQLGSVANRRVVRRWYEEYVNGHDVAVLDTLATDDFRSHSLSGAEGRSRDELKMFDGALFGDPRSRPHRPGWSPRLTALRSATRLGAPISATRSACFQRVTSSRVRAWTSSESPMAGSQKGGRS